MVSQWSQAAMSIYKGSFKTKEKIRMKVQIYRLHSYAWLSSSACDTWVVKWNMVDMACSFGSLRWSCFYNPFGGFSLCVATLIFNRICASFTYLSILWFYFQVDAWARIDESFYLEKTYASLSSKPTQARPHCGLLHKPHRRVVQFTYIYSPKERTKQSKNGVDS